MQSREMMKTQLVSCSHVWFIRETNRGETVRSACERESKMKRVFAFFRYKIRVKKQSVVL